MAKPKPKPSTKAAQPTAPAKKKREGGNGRVVKSVEAQAREIAKGIEAHLTAKEWRVLLLVLLNPEVVRLPLAQQAEVAEISARQLSRVKAKPAVQQVMQAVCMSRAIEAGDLVLDAAIKSAQIPGKDGHYDRRMLLEMGGLYSRVSTTQHVGKVEHEHTAKLEDKLNEARRQSQKAARQLAREEVVGFDDNEGPVIDADWQEEPTTSGGDEGL